MKHGVLVSMPRLRTYVEPSAPDFITFNAFQGRCHSTSLSVWLALCAAMRASIHHLTFQKQSTNFRRENDSRLKMAATGVRSAAQ